MNKLVVAFALGLLAACGSNPAGGGGGDGGMPCVPGVDPDCPVDCSQGIFQGCSCDPAVDTPVACYEGAAGTESTTPCMKGSRSCDAASATWGACDGQVVPEAEICDNGIDNDCDGAADEDVLSACGNCVPGCEDTGVGDDPFPLPPTMGTGGDGVGLDENAANPWIAEPLRPVLEAHRHDIELIRRRAQLTDGVVYIDLLDDPVEAHNKFISYFLFPDARYTVSLTRTPSRCKISVGSNPWTPDLRTHDIAALCERYGGGGHPVVGGISVPPDQVARAREIAGEIRAILST